MAGNYKKLISETQAKNFEIPYEHFSTLPEDEIAQMVREKIAGYVMTHQ